MTQDAFRDLRRDVFRIQNLSWRFFAKIDIGYNLLTFSHEELYHNVGDGSKQVPEITPLSQIY